MLDIARVVIFHMTGPLMALCNVRKFTFSLHRVATMLSHSRCLEGWIDRV